MTVTSFRGALAIACAMLLSACQHASPSTRTPSDAPAAPSTAQPAQPPPAPAPLAQSAPAPVASTPLASEPAPPPPEAAAPPPEPAQPEPAEPKPVEPVARFDGYRELHLGMSVAEVKKAWGSKLKRESGNEAGTCYDLSPGGGWSKSGTSFMIVNGKFVRYDISSNTEIAPGGGKLGMPASKIKKLYAGHIKQMGIYLHVKDAAGGPGLLMFELDDDGKVRAWRVGLKPDIYAEEGCF